MTRDTAERAARELAQQLRGFSVEEAATELTALLTQIQAEARERLAAWMTEHSFSTGHGDTFEDLLKELDWQVKELRGARLSPVTFSESNQPQDLALSEQCCDSCGITFFFLEAKDGDCSTQEVAFCPGCGGPRIAALAQALQPEEKEWK